MKKMKKLTAAVLTVGMLAAMPASTVLAEDEGYSVGFVTFGLGGDFFQSLADTFVETMEGAGWEAQYADGQYDPSAQMEAAENFIAMGVDVLVLWSVAPESMDATVEKAMDAGIKVVSFVAETSEYDALMVSEDADLADNCAKLAAKWIDETYADAEDHSVPVAVLSCRTADTGVVQADELIKIEEFSQKAKFETEVECQDEDMQTGLSATENLYTSNPDIKVFLTAHNGLALGINSYFTGLSSPVTEYDDMAIFAINGDSASGEIIKSSVDGESPFRGMVLTGSVQDTADELLEVCTGVMDGSLEKGYVQKAGTLFVYDETVDEYLETGTVTSVTAEDFE
ncbi:MAG TPA: substrate-binding domain-containing protein [Candidatus Blautia faecavium]|uniref:Substrate-binding domain-containing protein n=1 Tax=Candidatus Blautia faecavium TaxID=2838487 RepID=A0A9D2LR02_9FIRM|nr:substrate-binding domain-containing protein [Candidatus Blautia faecavium]